MYSQLSQSYQDFLSNYRDLLSYFGYSEASIKQINPDTFLRSLSNFVDKYSNCIQKLEKEESIHTPNHRKKLESVIQRIQNQILNKKF